MTHPSAQVPDVTTLSAGSFDPDSLSVTLTLEAEGAQTFTLERRLLGETDFTLISQDIEAIDGDATYQDTVPAFGNYEYVAHAVNSAGAGDPSSPVLVNAA